MNILSVECSAGAASAAVSCDGKILGEVFTNTALTHSRTLMHCVDAALRCAEVPFDTVDAFAVSSGPGSFTGIRIGCATVKGLASAQEKPCIPIPTLEGIAYALSGVDCVACAVMDARCGQVYTASFDCTAGFSRLCPDQAVSIEELGGFLKNIEKSIFFVGDGAVLCYNKLKETLSDVRLAPENIRYQRAGNLCLLAHRKYGEGGAIPQEALTPAYLRLAQAQRELKKRLAQQKGEHQ